MLMLTCRLSALAFAVTALVSATKLTKADNWANLTIQETKALFKVEATDPLNKRLSERCGVAAKWSDVAIPDQIARAQFGLSLHADLSSPIRGISPIEAFNLVRVAEGVFCDPDEIKAIRAEKKMAVATGKEAFQKHEMSSYSFPVFNSDHTKAILIFTGAESTWNMVTGHLVQDFNFFDCAYVFEKRKGQWRRTKVIPIDVS